MPRYRPARPYKPYTSHADMAHAYAVGAQIIYDRTFGACHYVKWSNNNATATYSSGGKSKSVNYTYSTANLSSDVNLRCADAKRQFIALYGGGSTPTPPPPAPTTNCSSVVCRVNQHPVYVPAAKRCSCACNSGYVVTPSGCVKVGTPVTSTPCKGLVGTNATACCVRTRGQCKVGQHWSLNSIGGCTCALNAPGGVTPPGDGVFTPPTGACKGVAGGVVQPGYDNRCCKGGGIYRYTAVSCTQGPRTVGGTSCEAARTNWSKQWACKPGTIAGAPSTTGPKTTTPTNAAFGIASFLYAAYNKTPADRGEQCAVVNKILAGYPSAIRSLTANWTMPNFQKIMPAVVSAYQKACPNSLSCNEAPRNCTLPTKYIPPYALGTASQEPTDFLGTGLDWLGQLPGSLTQGLPGTGAACEIFGAVNPGAAIECLINKYGIYILAGFGVMVFVILVSRK